VPYCDPYAPELLAGQTLVTNSTQITGQAPPPETPATVNPQPGGIREAVRRYPLWTSVIATAALGLGTLVFFNPVYETNDDVVMNLIAAGVAVVDHPDEHLLFINVVLGWPLSRLYMLAPGVPWYGISQFCALLAAAWGMAYALLRVSPSLRRLSVVLLVFVLALLPCLAQMQYTKTATLVSLAGLLLFLAPLRGATSWPRAADVAAGALLLLGSLIRFQSLLLALVIASPLLAVAFLAPFFPRAALWRAAAASASPRDALRRAAALAVTLAVVFALYAANRAYYASDPEWRDFYPFYGVRSQFTDFVRYEYTPETQPAFDAVGWEQIDWAMLVNWFYADRERYSLDKLRRITETAAPAPRPSLQSSVAAMARGIVEAPILRQFVLGTLCVAVFTGTGWRRFVLPCVFLGLAYAVTILLRSYYWNPSRVLISLFAGALVCTGLRPDSDNPDGSRPAAGRAELVAWWAAGLCTVYLVLRALQGMAGDDSYRQDLNTEVARAVRRMHLRPELLFVAWREQFPYQYLVEPLKDPAILKPFRCLAICGLQETPFHARRMQEFKIDDVYKAIWERPDVFLITDKLLFPYFARYVRAHYDKDLEFEVVVDHPDVPTFVIAHAKLKPAGG
jgi:hypothetical protein